MRGCTSQIGVFPIDHGGCIDLCFTGQGGPSPRELADRIFFGPKEQRPRCVFWIRRGLVCFGITEMAIKSPSPQLSPSMLFPKLPFCFGKDPFKRRLDLMDQWGFLDDKLVHGPLNTIVDKKILGAKVKLRGADETTRKDFDAIRPSALYLTLNPKDGLVLPYNERLVILRTHDGGWDLLWRNYRETEPPSRTIWPTHTNWQPQICPQG